MLVRVSVNVTMTVQPFYLEQVTFFCAKSLEPTSKALAIVPLISYTAQILFTVTLQAEMNKRFKNRQQPMLVAILLITISSLPLAFLDCDSKCAVYWLAGIQGVGLLIMLNTATSLISDVIGNDTEQSAFVYGAYSFFDKLANGLILIFIVQNYSSDAFALRWVMALTPVLCAIFAYTLSVMGFRLIGIKS